MAMKPKSQPKPAQVPTPPSASNLAEDQMKASKDAAVMQFGMNAVNQNTPFGNLTYNQVGTWGDGTPRYEANVSLSPEEQGIYSGLTDLTMGQMGRVGETLEQPFELGNEATEQRLYDLGAARLDPAFGRRRDAMESKLYNQGVMPGTEAYREAMAELGRQENDAYNQLVLTGRDQAVQESMLERNQPLNELGALSGMRVGGVNQPNFVNTPSTSIATPNVADYEMAAYQYGPLAQYEADEDYRMRQWQADEQNRQAMLGGIFGLGGAALAGPSLPFGGWARAT